MDTTANLDVPSHTLYSVLYKSNSALTRPSEHEALLRGHVGSRYTLTSLCRSGVKAQNGVTGLACRLRGCEYQI